MCLLGAPALKLLSGGRERLSGSDRPCLAAAAWTLTEMDGASLRNISASELPRLNFHRPPEEFGERGRRRREILPVEENLRSPEEKPPLISGTRKI